MPGQHPSRSLVIAAFAAIYIIWGSTYLGILLAIKTIPPFLMAASRFLIAGSLLLGFCLARGEGLPDRRSIAGTAFAGLLMLFVGNGAVTWSEQFLPSGLAAIIVATVPLWLVLLDRRQWSFHFTNKQIMLGLTIGFAGVILLFAGKSSAGMFRNKAQFLSVLVLVGGTIAWSFGTLVTKYRALNGSTYMKTAIQSLAAGVAFIIAATLHGEPQHFAFSQVSAESFWALIFLTVFGSIIAYLAFIWLLSVRPASLVGTYAYVNPGVAVFLGWLVAGETISVQKLIGLAVIVLGLVVVNWGKTKPK